MELKEGLSLDDVLLVPQYSSITSRKEPRAQSSLKNISRDFDLPIISSPMDTITGANMALVMSRSGGLGILHRNNNILKQCGMCQDIIQFEGDEFNDWGAAIGIRDDFLERAKALHDWGTSIFCVDVAHGHHARVKEVLKTLRKEFGNSIHIMAGNIATADGLLDLVNWGADSVRIGIGGGSICSTRLKTGFGVPNFTALTECYKAKIDFDLDISLIIDGGIREPGDVVKALAAGADFAMCGAALAGTEETPGEIENNQYGTFKTYRGMASKEAGLNKAGAEGISTRVPYRGSVVPILKEWKALINAGLSYNGALDIEDLRKNAVFVRQSLAAQAESFTHILNRKW